MRPQRPNEQPPANVLAPERPPLPGGGAPVIESRRSEGISDGERAFRALLACPRRGMQQCPGTDPGTDPGTAIGTDPGTAIGADAGTGIGADESGEAVTVAADDPRCLLVCAEDGWRPADQASTESRAVLDLYLPVRCRPGALTVAHLGQSLDGQIATASGDSYYVTGAANLLHLQRMRALCDAVLVGAGTVAADDPRLTVRLEDGAQPVRVVLDPRRRLGADLRVFCDDAAPTLLIADEAHARPGERHGQAEVVGVPAHDGRLALDALLVELHRRGLAAVFVEGGGTTVSRFLEAGLLDRLQVAIAPLVIGGGRPGLDLPGQDSIGNCLRTSHRVFRMGDDVLIDCDLRRPPNAEPHGGEVVRVL